MKVFISIVIVIGFVGVGVTAFTWYGIYNVAATDPHWEITVWFLEKVREHSISVHSKGITPRPLKNPKLVETGFRHYPAMCQLCHGAPGVLPAEFAKGLNPRPPDLASEGVQELSSAELYWVIKNGIKMTGMPAFGITHNEDELWAMVAFVKRLPDLKPEEYEALVKATHLAEDQQQHGPSAH